MRIRSVWPALVAVPLLALTACGGSSGSTAASSAPAAESAPASAAASAPAAAGTVSVDVGNGTPINLKTGPLKVAFVMLDDTNSWEQHVLQSATDTATKLGWTIDTFSAGFDVQKELNTLRTIATSGEYDAVAAVPVDGTQECQALTKDLPAANILVTVGDVPVCGLNTKPAKDQWTPGLLTWVGGTGITLDFYLGWLKATAMANPGPQNVGFVTGPPQVTVVQTETLALKEFAKTNPDFKVDVVECDFTTNGTYKAVTNFLQSHPETTLLMSTGSIDMDRGILNAIKQLGLEGKVTVVESGGTQAALDLVKSGDIQSAIPLTPNFLGSTLVQAIADAQAGQEVPRYITDLPEGR